LPVAALVEAAGQIEQGDYGARVPERGPREVRTLARAFNAMSERLEAVDARRRSFLADVAHELRTPLTVIQGRVEAMIDGVDPRDDAQLERVLSQAQTLDRVVEDLRVAALAETGSLVLEREPLELGAFVADVTRDFGPEAGGRGVRLCTDVAAGDLIAEIDAIRVRQVLVNLLTNSLRYTPPGGETRLDLVRDGEYARIEISDTGPGIPRELTDTLFERFTKSSESPGIGLGLAIARDLAAAHGGTIEAPVPAAGSEGALIRVNLPLSSV
jgi:two-component system sensor histidine kinase BaeS